MLNKDIIKLEKIVLGLEKINKRIGKIRDIREKSIKTNDDRLIHDWLDSSTCYIDSAISDIENALKVDD